MSALAGCLKLLGSNIGSSLLQAPTPKSYPLFEHADIISVHERLFDELGLSWDKLSPMPENWLETPAANKAEQRLLRILKSDFFNTDHWVIKDFRLCRLFPLWLKVLESIDITTIPVIMLRHPDEAIQSMKNFYNLQPDSAKLLWYFYNQWALRSCGSSNPFFFTYDQVLANPIETLDSLARKCGLPWTHSLCNHTPLLLNFIQPGLKQYFITSSQHEHENSPYIQLYNQLRWQKSASENLPDLHELHQNLQTHHDSTPPHIWALLNDILFQMSAIHTQSFNASSRDTASSGPIDSLVQVSLRMEMDGQHMTISKVQIPPDQWEQIFFSMDEVDVQEAKLDLVFSGTAGIAHISSLMLSHSATGKILWSCNAKNDFTGLDYSSALLVEKNQDVLKCLTIDNDFYISLTLPNDLQDVPIILQCRLKFEKGIHHYLVEHKDVFLQVSRQNDEIMSLKSQLAQSSQRWEQTAGMLSQVVQTNDELIQKLSARMQDRPAQGEES